MRIKSENFVKIVQTRGNTEGQIYGQNSKFWQFWGLYSHISASINVKFGKGPVSNLRAGRKSCFSTTE